MQKKYLNFIVVLPPRIPYLTMSSIKRLQKAGIAKKATCKSCLARPPTKCSDSHVHPIHCIDHSNGLLKTLAS